MGYSGAGGKLIHEKNQKQKISWHCPFNPPILPPFACAFPPPPLPHAEVVFLDVILRLFLHAIHKHLYQRILLPPVVPWTWDFYSNRWKRVGHGFIYIIYVFNRESIIVLSHTVHITVHLYINTISHRSNN